MNRRNLSRENGQDNDRDRFYNTENRNQKAVAANRKLPGTSSSYHFRRHHAYDDIGPNAEVDEDHFLVLRMGDVDKWQKAKTVRWEEVLGIRYSILASMSSCTMPKVSTSKGVEIGLLSANGE
jgi:hypothetical protein